MRRCGLGLDSDKKKLNCEFYSFRRASVGHFSALQETPNGFEWQKIGVVVVVVAAVCRGAALRQHRRALFCILYRVCAAAPFAGRKCAHHLRSAERATSVPVRIPSQTYHLQALAIQFGLPPGCAEFSLSAEAQGQHKRK